MRNTLACACALLGAAQLIYALQIPLLDELQTFQYDTVLSELKSYFTHNQDDKDSYSTKDPSVWPLDLTQYEGVKVLRIYIDETNNELVKSLRDVYKAWEMNNEFIDLEVPEGDLSDLSRIIKFETVIEDLPQTIFESYPQSKNFSIMDHMETDFHTMSDIFFKEYRPLHTIYAWLDILKETYPELVEIEWLGQTFEGRDMKAIHLSAPTGMNPTKKTIVMTAGVHAREWISTSTVLWIMYQLLTKYGDSKKETNYLNHLDFLIVPVFNPDGYDYTWNSDRLWRKNRQETYIPKCFGIDIDHSFDYHWTRSDDHPCGESYSGETQFEAIEAGNLNRYINVTKEDHDIYGFMDFHSYTQKILYPYAYSCEDSPRDIENLLELAYGLSKSIRLKKGKHYEVVRACQDRGVDFIPGLGAGSSLDYMYHNRARWAFQFKLRDTGSHGFLLPSEYIGPVGREMYKAVQYFCEFILSPDR